jgi:imidazolonepropionase
VDLLLKNIHQLVCVASDRSVVCKRGVDMQVIEIKKNAYVAITNGIITDLGDAESCPLPALNTKVIDCSDRLVLPGFVDSHTHLIFSHTREQEFVMRLKGKSYSEIAAAGGGILNSANRLAATSDEILLNSALKRLDQVSKWGTTTIEIKSGYGLDRIQELRMLRIARQLATLRPEIKIKTTLLAAHALPTAYQHRRADYIDMICKEMIPSAAEEGLADFVDVFCETGFFTVAETEKILATAVSLGLKAKVHANELDYSGGVQVGCQFNAASVDHLECVGEAEIAALVASKNTIATLLPATAFFLGIKYAPARLILANNIAVAIATDYNPGTAPGGNMGFIITLACTQMKMLPEEAICAATLNGAAALCISDQVGSIAVGKNADLLITQPLDSIAALPYHYNGIQYAKIIANGKIIHDFE